jgi:hypothetical protein
MGTTGSLLQILFTITFPTECNHAICQQNFINEVENRVAQMSKNLTLALPLTNSTMIQIDVSFCSINEVNSSEYILFVKSKQTTADLFTIRKT